MHPCRQHEEKVDNTYLFLGLGIIIKQLDIQTLEVKGGSISEAMVEREKEKKEKTNSLRTILKSLDVTLSL